MAAKPVRGIGADHPDRQGVREHNRPVDQLMHGAFDRDALGRPARLPLTHPAWPSDSS
jgi:hypothetical protein